MTRFAIGETVEVRPRNGLRVQAQENLFGRMLAPEWTAVPYTDWIHRRYRDGSIEVRRPTSTQAETE